MAIQGDWSVFFDWERDGTYRKIVLTFNNDGTWISPEGHRGRWVEAGGMFIMNFTGSGTIYAGNVSGFAMTGISSTFASQNGNWHAIKDGIVTTLKEATSKTGFAG
jgi:hypothetical protein